MKHYIALLAALLCLAGHEWRHHELGPFNWNDKGETIYRLHFIVGTVRHEWNYDRVDAYCDRQYTVPGNTVIWMTPEEMEKANATLKAGGGK